MSQMIHGLEVNRPTPDPLKSSVLDHATVVDNATHFGLTNNEGLWPSYNCLDTMVPTPICPDPVAVKTFAFAPWVPGFEFAVHGGVQCRAIGLDENDQKSEVERVFALNEGKAVEQALLLNRFVASDSETAGPGEKPLGVWDAPVDLTDGLVVGPAAALALLEGYAASVYAGVPTIHMPRALGSLLNERIVWEGDKAYTRMGSKVAFGGGYDDPENLSGEWEMFATGEVYVERAKTLRFQQWVVPGDGNGIGSDETGIAENSVIALVERMFRVGVDCFVAKATAAVAAVDGGGFGI